MDKKCIQETMKDIKTEDDDGFPQYNENTIVCKTESRIKSEDFDNNKNENFCEISIEKEKESLDAKEKKEKTQRMSTEELGACREKENI